MFLVIAVGKNQKFLPFRIQTYVLRNKHRFICMPPPCACAIGVAGVKLGGGPIGDGLDPPPGNDGCPPGRLGEPPIGGRIGPG